MDRPPRPERRAFVFDREGIRAVDRAAIDEYGFPGFALMENASTALRDACLPLLDGPDPFVLIVAGPGNNGGDGLALARRLHNERVRTATVITAAPDRYRGDAAANLRIVERIGLPLFLADGPAATPVLEAAAEAHGEPVIIVDALFGTGLDRPLHDPFPEIVAWINRRSRDGATTVSVDIPSGLDCDTGQPLGKGPDAAVRADVTVTLAGLKLGFSDPIAKKYLGKVVVGDIGTPVELSERFAVGGG